MPAKLGHYRLIAPIGQGGMGMVFHAFDEELERDVALKVLHQHLIDDPKQLKRFEREARMQGQLTHPNIVQLLDSYESNHSLALIMELMEGCTLKEYAKYRGVLDLGEIITISQDILSGLQAAHEHDVTHRDMKLSNVFLGNDGITKLMDFGLAKSRESSDDITSSGVTVGSYYYMAPEQILGNSLDARTDLYAFGVILYRLATGKLPFTSSGGGEFEIMEKQVRQQAPAPESVNNDISEELSAVITALLEKDPEKRPESCQAALELINALGEATPLSLKSESDSGQVSSFSELHEYLIRKKGKSDGSPETEGATVTSEQHIVEEIAEHTLIWAFKESPEASGEPPLDLRSPPPIQGEVLKRLRTAINDIPPLPEIWGRIQTILNAPDASPSDLAKEVEQDPILTAHVLKICNSAAYTMPGSKPVTSVALALTRLGMDTAHDIILQMVVPDFGSNKKSDPEARYLWYHGQAVSLVSRMLAEYNSILDSRSASLFGMLHDIGKLVILHLEEQEKLDELREAIQSGTPALKAEWDILGYTHIDAGMMLALHWRLPRSIHHFIYYHHHPAWHTPDFWPSDVQPVIMLVHMSHLVLEMIGEEDNKSQIWATDRRTHLPETESFLYKPLHLPLTNAATYAQLEQDVAKLKLNFPDIFPVDEEVKA
ncbi:MAG: HDOD domain-containing protein [Mariprofundaceae bacterium]